MGGGFQERLGMQEFKSKDGNLWRSFVGEFIGNLLLNLIGCASCVNVVYGLNAPADIVLIALTFGITVFFVVSTIGHISGGHVNPAVTIALLATGKVTIARALVYIIAQCVGAVAGSGILKALTPDNVQGTLGLTGLSGKVTPAQGVGIEFFLGFILIFTIYGVCDPFKPDAKPCAPLAIGLTVTAGHLAAVDYTGAAMNPARALGSAVIANVWDNHWIYWVGPICGAVAAALIYANALAGDENGQYARAARSEKEMRRMDANA